MDHNDEVDDFIPPQIPDQPKEISVKGSHLSMIQHGLTTIPADLGDKYGETVSELDFSHNQLTKVENLEKFKKLQSLVLDNNQLESKQQFYYCKSLTTLWVNNNNIEDLKEFLDAIVIAFPNIDYLSMLKNPACPNFFYSDKDDDDYQRYRYYVLYRLKKLKFLDSGPVTAKERKEAERVGAYSLPARVNTETLRRKQEELQRQQKQDSEFKPLPQDLKEEGKGSARFGISTHTYQGKHSEGNRFILNEDL